MLVVWWFGSWVIRSADGFVGGLVGGCWVGGLDGWSGG